MAHVGAVFPVVLAMLAYLPGCASEQARRAELASAERSFCHHAAEMAKEVMYLRQRAGGDASMLHRALVSVRQVDDPVVREMIRQFAIEAYQRPQVPAAEQWPAVAQAFSDEFYRNCMSDQ